MQQFDLHPLVRNLSPYFKVFPFRAFIPAIKVPLTKREIRSWIKIHPSYLSSQECLDLGYALMHGREESKRSFLYLSELLEIAARTAKGPQNAEINLLIAILHFEQIFKLPQSEQQNFLRLAEYHCLKSLKNKADCLLSHLHLILIYVARDKLPQAIKRLHLMSRLELDGQTPLLYPVYETLEKIYRGLGKDQLSEFYRIKREKKRIPLFMTSQKGTQSLSSGHEIAA